MKRSRHIIEDESDAETNGDESADPTPAQTFSQWWDDNFPEHGDESVNCRIPDRKESLDYYHAQKVKLKEVSGNQLKKIVEMPEVTNYEETIKGIIDGRIRDPGVKKAVCEYVATRLRSTTHIVGMLLEVEDWDEEILQMIIDIIGELDDLGIEVPELENISMLADASLKAKDNKAVQAFMAKSLRGVVVEWLRNSNRPSHRMEVWSENPTSTFEPAKLRLPGDLSP